MRFALTTSGAKKDGSRLNAVAAYEHVGRSQGVICADFGTATTFDVISPAGEYLGGAIAPGVTVSVDALFLRASKLPRIELRRPSSVVGRNTVASMQSGIVFGYIGLVDGIVRRMLAELDYVPRVLATGGLAELIGEESETIQEVVPDLTLTGLRLLYERNRPSLFTKMSTRLLDSALSASLRTRRRRSGRLVVSLRVRCHRVSALSQPRCTHRMML